MNEESPSRVTPKQPKLFLGAEEVKRLRTLLEDAPGPTNWWWKTKRRPVRGPGGKSLEWRSTAEVMWEMWLTDRSGLTATKYLRMSLYCWAHPVAEDRLLIWRQFPLPPPRNVVRLSLFDTASLEPIRTLMRSRKVEKAAKPFWDMVAFKGGLLAEADLPGDWTAGTHLFAFPPPMDDLAELPMPVATFPGRTNLEGRRTLKRYVLPSLYLARPKEGLVEVLTLGWAKSALSSRRWIARVVRDPLTRNLLGDGIRVPPFLMDSRGRFLGWVHAIGQER